MRKIILPLLLLLVGACSRDEVVPEPYRPTDAWDAYRHGLETAGLGQTALGHDWLAAAADALRQPVTAPLPYLEQGSLDPRSAYAFGYRVQARRGQRIEVLVRLESDGPARLFLDLYRLGDAEPLHVASGDPDTGRLVFEPRRDAEYVLRLQPELLRGGRYTVELRSVAALEFPVRGRDVTDIQSGFGAPRDAGRRSHHGVDIFAPRDTPVLAASRARVRRVGEQRLGGNVIWLYDEQRSLNLYYAHLESQAVSVGEWVEAGEVIGAVGNSGNAHTTPTHLHFGIYARGEGPLDPDGFLRQPPQEPAPVRADSRWIGGWVQTRAGGSALQLAPSRRAESAGLLEAGVPVRVWAATGAYYRVTTMTGAPGFLSMSQVAGPRVSRDLSE